ncbi:MAG: hypothetical protein M0Q95_20990, partial [Porticoccaceae bacterium]|nr:hypothetical protein [Porticoccaceae bacterium]
SWAKAVQGKMVIANPDVSSFFLRLHILFSLVFRVITRVIWCCRRINDLSIINAASLIGH